MPLMKTLTFNIICSLVFGIEKGAKRDILIELYGQMLEGILSVPINLPFTQFNRSLRASAKVRAIVMETVHEKKAALEQQTADPQQDLITSLLTLRNKDGSTVLSDEEIVDNAVLMMIAGYDTTSALLSCLIRLFAKDASVCANVVQGMQTKWI